MPSNYTKKNGYTSAGKQRYKPDKKNYLYNIDTLWLNFGSYHYDDVMDCGLRDSLIAGRLSKQDDGDSETVIQCKIDAYKKPISFEINTGNPPLYQYSLRNDSMAIYFSKNERENQLPMRVQLNQFLLWEKGVEGAYHEAHSVLRALGFLPSEVRINRVDFAVHSDQFNWTLEDMKTFSYPENIKKDNKPNYYKLDVCSGEFGTMMVGDRSRLAMRIYNKSKEIEDKKKYYFYELYEKHGINPDKVWNIEIEVRRPFLADLCEDDEDLKKLFDDFNYCLSVDGLSRLWSLLMGKYHHDSAHWSMLTKLDKHFAFNTTHGLTIHKDVQSNFEREIPQILGRLRTAVLTEEDYSLEHAIEKLCKAMPEYERKQKLKGKQIVTFEERVALSKSKIQNVDINNTIENPTKLKRDMYDQNKLANEYRKNNNEYKKEKKSVLELRTDLENY
ncbi:replication initiation protein [Viridibacillus arvi]|uniref:replication initiation protein n=1 Tax=Viridibacillus arvi TaxID=263475 RepID=UPI003CFD0963